MPEPAMIREAPLRSTVQIQLPAGRALEGPRGASLQAFLAGERADAPIVGAILNGELRELTYPIDADSRVRLVTLGEADGMRIYRRSLTFLIAAAFEELFPKARLTVDHSISSGGYFCQIEGRPPLRDRKSTRLNS